MDYIIYLFSYIYVRYISHISRLPLGIINRYAFSWGDQTLEKALENAKKGISDFDEKMEPITGKKRKADKSANSGTSKKSRFVNALAHLLIKTNFGTSFYEINQCLNQVQQFSSIFF